MSVVISRRRMQRFAQQMQARLRETEYWRGMRRATRKIHQRERGRYNIIEMKLLEERRKKRREILK